MFDRSEKLQVSWVADRAEANDNRWVSKRNESEKFAKLTSNPPNQFQQKTLTLAELVECGKTWEEVSITDDAILCFALSNFAPYQSLIVFNNGGIYLTTRKTQELLKERSEEHSYGWEAFQMICRRYFHLVSKIPYIDCREVWLPLTGTSRQSASWFNLCHLKRLISCSGRKETYQDSCLIFENGLHFPISHGYRRLQERAKKAATIFLAYQEMQRIIARRFDYELPDLRLSSYLRTHKKKYPLPRYRPTSNEWLREQQRPQLLVELQQLGVDDLIVQQILAN